MSSDLKKRIIKVLIINLLLAVLGIAYGIFCYYTELGVPCLIKHYTGFSCPACGITHFIIYSARFRFKEAIEYNYYAPAICIILATIYIDNIVHYIKTGKMGVSRLTSLICICLIPGAIVWGILRNIYVM